MKESVNKKNWLDRLTDFIENKLAPPLIKISQNRYLQSLQNAFIVMMPYMILGATATLVLNLGGLFAEGTGLNMPQVAETVNNLVDIIRPALLQIVFVSINIMALLTVIINSYFFILIIIQYPIIIINSIQRIINQFPIY